MEILEDILTNEPSQYVVEDCEIDYKYEVSKKVFEAIQKYIEK